MKEREVSSERVSEEQLRAMLAGLDGVTPGPWTSDRHFSVGPRSQLDDQTFNMMLPMADVFGDNKAADTDHIARCDPDTIRSILSELLALRSSVRTVGDAAFEAVLNCPHVIEGARVVLKADYEKPGNALAQLHARLSALEAPSPQEVPSEVTEALKRAVAILDGELGSSWGERNHADWSLITAALKGDRP